MRRIDVKLAVVGLDPDGKEISGTITARFDASQVSWPDQQWDRFSEGTYPLGPPDFVNGAGHAPIQVKEVLSATIVE